MTTPVSAVDGCVHQTFTSWSPDPAPSRPWFRHQLTRALANLAEIKEALNGYEQAKNAHHDALEECRKIPSASASLSSNAAPTVLEQTTFGAEGRSATYATVYAEILPVVSGAGEALELG